MGWDVVWRKGCWFAWEGPRIMQQLRLAAYSTGVSSAYFETTGQRSMIGILFTFEFDCIQREFYE